MQMKSMIGGLVLAGLAAHAGAGADVDKHPREAGWRAGTVVEIGPARALERPSYYDCRRGPAAGQADEPYVVVAFLRNGRPYARAAPLAAADASLQVGDKVYVNIEDCGATVAKRDS